ncbi:MAG TPA: nucleoside diphosphate kinase regulator [Kofleriaceae bacterium]|nr:nucleoside diphosphate kinase regulator [Kofleriaceae bacterium]
MLTPTSQHNPSLIITDRDLARLRQVIDLHDTPSAEQLDSELQRATVVDSRAVPPTVVTMHSEVVYEDRATGERRTVAVVFPHEADAGRGKVSVLAPIGSALIGLSVGQEIEWRVPGGRKRVRVVEIRYQPEASGSDRGVR